MSVSAGVRFGMILFICVAIVLSIGGCKDDNSVEEEKQQLKPYWNSTAYTLEEINQKFHSEFYNDEREFKSEDISDNALNAYNIALGYVENIFGQNYYIYDYYYADWTEPPYTWIVKIIPYEIALKAEKEGRTPGFDEIMLMYYDEDGGCINSTIEPYFMARRWMADLKREMLEHFPQYSVQLKISELDNIYPDVLKTNFAGLADYSYIINDEFYYRLNEWQYGNFVSIIVPENTKQSDAVDIFAQMKPILEKYCITEAYFFAPESKEVFDEWVEEEWITSNDYSLSSQLVWREHFTIQKAYIDKN